MNDHYLYSVSSSKKKTARFSKHIVSKTVKRNKNSRSSSEKKVPPFAALPFQILFQHIHYHPHLSQPSSTDDQLTTPPIPTHSSQRLPSRCPDVSQPYLSTGIKRSFHHATRRLFTVIAQRRSAFSLTYLF